MTGGKIISGLITRVAGESGGTELILTTLAFMLINIMSSSQGTTSMVLNISEEAFTMKEGTTIPTETLIIITISIMFIRTNTSMATVRI
jgi:hypothetical protein